MFLSVGSTRRVSEIEVLEDGESDYQVLLDYFELLNGDFSAYTEPAGRINVR